eukprot:jgi/Undpi1/434/HiC_scaffold_1.g00430.m1
MGQSTSKAKADLAESSDELDSLMSMALKQIDLFRVQVKETRGNEALLSKTEVTGGRTLRFKEFIKVTTSNGLDSDIEAAVGDFFTTAGDGAAGDNQGAKQSAIQGAKKMVIGGLNAFLGATQAGETMAHDFFVIFLNNAFIRVDTHLKRALKAKALGAEASQSIVGYLCALAVIPMSVLEPDEIDFLLSEALAAEGDEDDFANVQELAVNLKILKTLTGKLTNEEQSLDDLKALVTTITELNKHVKESYARLKDAPVNPEN